MISKDDVQKLADLAHVAVPDPELEKIAGEMDSILTYVSDVSKLASEEGEREKDEVYNVMRDDVVTNESRQYSDDIIAQFPDKERGYLRVKKIL
jgi:aspartyl/glutamyl-tRNA(Asn/Gln) amidotransferase C subunit